MIVTTETITPRIAEAWLNSNKSNRWGALSVETPGGLLGIKPGEYHATRWRRNE